MAEYLVGKVLRTIFGMERWKEVSLTSREFLNAFRVSLAVLSASCALVGFAHADPAQYWEVTRDRLRQVSGPQVRLNIGSSGGAVFVPTTQVGMLLDVRERIEKASWLSARVFITDAGMPSPNAMATSGPQGALVAINIAMLRLIGDDADALAAVIGHEYAHIALNHRDSRKERESVRQGLGAVLGLVLGLAGVPMASTIADLGTTAISQSFSRDEERDADEKGIKYSATAGFSIEGGIRVWEKMAATAQTSAFPFLASHPAPEERIATMRVLAQSIGNQPQTVANTTHGALGANSSSTRSSNPISQESSSLVASDGTPSADWTYVADFDLQTGSKLLGRAKVFVSRKRPPSVFEDPNGEGEHRLWVLAQVAASPNARSMVTRAWLNCESAYAILGNHLAIGYQSTNGQGESVGTFKIEWPKNSGETIRRQICP